MRGFPICDKLDMVMAPRTRPRLVKLSPEVEAHVREALEESEREGYADMTPEETRRAQDR